MEVDKDKLGISTPVAGHAMEEDHLHGAAAAGGGAAPGGAAASAVVKPATSIPAYSYTMPGPPTWRVKPQFAAWEVRRTAERPRHRSPPTERRASTSTRVSCGVLAGLAAGSSASAAPNQRLACMVAARWCF